MERSSPNGELLSAGLPINNVIKKNNNIIFKRGRKRNHRGLTCEVISVLKILSRFQNAGNGLVCTSTRLPSRHTRQNRNQTQQFDSHMGKNPLSSWLASLVFFLLSPSGSTRSGTCNGGTLEGIFNVVPKRKNPFDCVFFLPLMRRRQDVQSSPWSCAALMILVIHACVNTGTFSKR